MVLIQNLQSEHHLFCLLIRYGPAPHFGYNVCFISKISSLNELCYWMTNQLFRVDQMLSDATGGEVTRAADIANKGAVILVTSRWDCDLDLDEDSMY